MPKYVYFLILNTKPAHFQNRYVEKCTSFFLFGMFPIIFLYKEKLLKEQKNGSDKIPTRYTIGYWKITLPFIRKNEHGQNKKPL